MKEMIITLIDNNTITFTEDELISVDYEEEEMSLEELASQLTYSVTSNPDKKTPIYSSPNHFIIELDSASHFIPKKSVVYVSIVEH